MADTPEEVGLTTPPVTADFAEPGTDDNDGFHAFGNALVHDAGHAIGRYRYEGQIDWPGNFSHRWVRLHAVNRRRRGMHHRQATGVAARDHVVQQLRADLAALAVRADDDEAARAEDMVHGCGRGGERP